MNGDHPDLLLEAAGLSVREAAQLASVLAAAGRVLLRRKARQDQIRHEREDRARRIAEAQQQAQLAATRARWAPGNDKAWLPQAGLLDVATIWGAAIPYADPAASQHEPSAATAVRNCEDRLRQLHPYAMSRYDRLRGDGMAPVEAMQEALPLFRLAPRAYERGTSVRLAVGQGNGLGHSWAAAVHGPDRADFEAERHRSRGLRIADGIRAQAGRSLGESEQRAALESATNLSDEVIETVVRPVAVAPYRERPWLQDFPFSIQEVLAATASSRERAADPRRASQVTEREPQVRRSR